MCVNGNGLFFHLEHKLNQSVKTHILAMIIATQNININIEASKTITGCVKWRFWLVRFSITNESNDSQQKNEKINNG